MTNDDALGLIKARMGGEDSDMKNNVAQAAIQAAFSSFDRLGAWKFNEKRMTVTISSPTITYYLRDLDGGETIITLAPKIYLSTYSYVVPVVDFDEYEETKEPSSTMVGRPQLATLYGTGNDRAIELFPIPDATYTGVFKAYCRITDITQLPAEFHDIAVDRATMFAIPAKDKDGSENQMFQMAMLAWQEALPHIMVYGETIWKGNQIAPDNEIFRIGTEQYTLRPDRVDTTG